jgi:hypothetical protein
MIYFSVIITDFYCTVYCVESCKFWPIILCRAAGIEALNTGFQMSYSECFGTYVTLDSFKTDVRLSFI